MWGAIAALPVAVQITVPIIAAILLIIVALWGKVNIKWGSYRIGFGQGTKRSCNDCMLLTFAKREEFEVNRRKIENSILKNQMNFTEHKLESVVFDLTQDYREQLKQKRKPEADLDREYKESLMYEEILKQSIHITKDEIRRSFKENGFHEMDDFRFQQYIKNKASDLINRARSYLAHRYPASGMIIPIDERINRLNINKMEDVCSDIYMNAKSVRNKAEEEIKEIEDLFIKDIHKMISEEE
jgi:hypothetical protein